jgi:5-methyltetrahydrofolate--homocysteine methyltransferase
MAILNIHRSYLEAGADIIETNTFNSTAISQADYGLEEWVFRVNQESAELAMQACAEFSTPDHPRFVAGSIGPTNKTTSMSPDVNNPGFRAVTFDDLVKTYTEQVLGLIAGGVDVFLVETVFDTLNAKAALFAINQVNQNTTKHYPVMLSGTITDSSGRTLSGQTTRAFLISVQQANLFSIGLNCALGAKQLVPYLDVLSEHASCAVSAHPNAGLPDEMGEYTETPELMAIQIKEYLDRKMVNIVGGCCGTTPEHIQAIAELAKQYEPREYGTTISA